MLTSLDYEMEILEHYLSAKPKLARETTLQVEVMWDKRGKIAMPCRASSISMIQV